MACCAFVTSFMGGLLTFFFFFSSRRRHTRCSRDWSSDVCSSDLEYAKDDPRDFALWKKAEPADEQVGAAWDAPFGRGRPGWHLECSAMSLEQIGKCCRSETLDLHAGGVDLIFPHHEDEIAQSEAATGKPFARFRSEEHTSELQSRLHLVCRLLLEKKKIKRQKY